MEKYRFGARELQTTIPDLIRHAIACLTKIESWKQGDQAKELRDLEVIFESRRQRLDLLERGRKVASIITEIDKRKEEIAVLRAMIKSLQNQLALHEATNSDDLTTLQFVTS